MEKNNIFIGIERVKNGFLVMSQVNNDTETMLFEDENFDQKSLHFTVNKFLNMKIELS